jgi:hypothetical protein
MEVLLGEFNDGFWMTGKGFWIQLSVRPATWLRILTLFLKPDPFSVRAVPIA